MRKRVNIIALVAAAATLTISVGPGQAQPTKHAAPAHPYLNPFTDPAWSPARTDMGVDWIPQKRLPVRAIGDALILGSNSHASWPGGHIIWYRLLNGSHAGDIIYVAENLRHLVAAGTTVHAGQKIVTVDSIDVMWVFQVGQWPAQ